MWPTRPRSEVEKEPMSSGCAPKVCLIRRTETQEKALKEKIKKAEKEHDPTLESMKKALHDVEAHKKETKEKVKEVEKEEKLRPWNVDTISTDGFSKTLINTLPPPVDKSNMSEEEKESYMREFVKKHEEKIKHYGWLSRYDDSRKYLLENNYLACEETANYLVIQCINLAMEEKFGAMEQVSHQCIAMQYLLELAKQLDVDPRACIGQFFTK